MRRLRPLRMYYFKVLLELSDGSIQAMRVIDHDCLGAIRTAEDLHFTAKNALPVVSSSAVQQLDPLFEPMTTVN